MNGKYVVSIIVPIYNVEKYLEQCLASIYALSMEQVQVVLVDDGSTDSSLEIIKSFAKQYPDNTIVIEQTHSSVSAARNAGIREASGEWIAFVDSDDFIDPIEMGKIYENLPSIKSDVLAFDGHRYVEENGNTLPLNKHQNPFYEKGSVQGINYLTKLIANDMINVVTIWDKVYKRSMLERIKLTFIEGLLHEDVAYIFTLFLNEVTVEYSPQKAINYRQRPGSIMYTPSPHKIYSKIKIIEYLVSLFESHPQQFEPLNDYLVFSAKGLILDKHKIPSELLKHIWKRKLSAKKRVLLAYLFVKNRFI